MITACFICYIVLQVMIENMLSAWDWLRAGMGFIFERHSDRPAFSPSVDGPDSGCVEDPRIVKFDGEYYITYAYRRCHRAVLEVWA